MDRESNAPSEPRCAACGYSLQGLTEPRCPECGTAFDPATLPTRLTLLAWERTESGGMLKRAARTIADAWLHPMAYAAQFRERIHKPIERPISLIAIYALFVCLLWMVGYILSSLVFYLNYARLSGSFQQASSTLRRLLSNTLPMLPREILNAVLPLLIAVVIFALSMRALMQLIRPSARLRDLIVWFAPAAVFVPLPLWLFDILKIGPPWRSGNAEADTELLLQLARICIPRIYYPVLLFAACRFILRLPRILAIACFFLLLVCCGLGWKVISLAWNPVI